MGCTTSRANTVTTTYYYSTNTAANSNNDAPPFAAPNTTFPSNTYNPTNTSSTTNNPANTSGTTNPTKNIALEESTKSITALAHYLGPNDTAVQTILKYYQHPILASPLLYWPCKLCTTHNHAATEKCISCNEGRCPTDNVSLLQTSNEKDASSPPTPTEKSTIMDEALSSIECSICLDTLTQPITLPCGHSLCSSHHSEIDYKCPFCRTEFSQTIPKSEFIDASLTQNVNVVLQLANLLDSERDTVRDAIHIVDMGKCVIPVGTIVSLQGLVNTAFNGRKGVVKMYNAESGRYAVSLEENPNDGVVVVPSDYSSLNRIVSVQPEKVLQHARICIHGVLSRPELNGVYGTIVSWCPVKDRYNVELQQEPQEENPKIISLQPKNVRLESGTVVRFVNLVNKPEMNGTWGTIQDFVEGGDVWRYDVQLTTQRTIRINMENVRV